MERVLYEVKKVIVGQDHLLERMIVALLARGHLLVEGVPGLAKTMAIKTLADAIGGDFKRIQFTPDLVPADLVGTRIYNQKTGEFNTSLGPVFTNLLLADEINRAPAKVQSALLEVMQERQVTIGRETHKVPDPFLVMATQNPIETEGTYALPEAQVDRFMLKVLIGYPTPTEEFVIVERQTGPLGDRPAGPLDRRPARAPARGRPRCTSIRRSIEYAVRLATATRAPRAHGMPELERYITYGASPRASINLILTARALAFVRGRDYALPQDVVDMARDVIRHRLVLSFEALSDNVTRRRHPARPCWAGSRCPSSPSGSSPTSASAPERVLQRLDWQVIRRLDGLLQGDYRTLFHGNGVDLADLREYQPGDDVRYIDWNVTARMDTPYVREYHEDREITAWFLLDLSPSVDFGTVGRRAAQADRPDRLRDDPGPPADPARQPGRRRVLRRRGRAHDPGPAAAASRCSASSRTCSASRGCPARRSPTSRRCSRRPATRSSGVRSSFVISDFISAPGWERPLDLLDRRHEVLAVRLIDPREVGPARRGPDHHGGRRDRRAALRRHPRQGLPAPVRGGGEDPRGDRERGLPAGRRRCRLALDGRGPRPGDRPDGDAPSPAAAR